MAEIVRRLRTTVGVEVYSRAFWLTFAVKAVLICLLVFGALSGLQQFEGKVFLWRLVTYPIAALGSYYLGLDWEEGVLPLHS